MNFPAPVSFQEADDFLRSRQDTATYLNSRDIAIRWDAEARQAAFFSARVTQAAIVSRLHDVCQAVLSGEMSRAQARRLLREYFLGEGADPLAAMGFAPARRAMGLAQLASLPRLELIVYQNVKMAQERGHYQQWQKVRQDFPYGIWRVGNCANHREKHLARDGKIYAFDHPIWTQSPPGGEFNCHCYRELLSEQDMKERGLSPEPPDSPFEPSSLGFDPSRPLADEPHFGRTTRPQYADQARRQCEEERPRVQAELENRQQEQTRLVEQARLEEQARLAGEARMAAAEEAARLEKEGIAREESKTNVEVPQKERSFDAWFASLSKPSEPDANNLDAEEQKIYNKIVERQKYLDSHRVGMSSSQANSIMDEIRNYWHWLDNHFTEGYCEKHQLAEGKQSTVSYTVANKSIEEIVKRSVSCFQKIIPMDVAKCLETITFKEAVRIPGHRFMSSCTLDGKTIFVKPGENIIGILHEMAHAIEDRHPMIKRRCIEFLERRTRGKPLVSIKTLAKGNYGKDEKAWKDDFCHPYIGKAYLDKDGKIEATEVLSVGIEYLVGRGSWFFKEDIEHYILTVNLLNGIIQ